MSKRKITRDLTYAMSAKGKGGQSVIRVMENVTGRIGLIRKARGYADEVAGGANFWNVMSDRYGLSLDVIGGSLSNLPRTGPLIIVANHPYGVLDGLMMGRILSERRDGDFRVLANDVFAKAPDLRDVILPIDFAATKAAVQLNLKTRRTAFDYLDQGGAVGVFPGGTVSTAPRPFGRAIDPRWRSFTAKMIAKSDATVVPIYFDGSNSRLFQIASHLHVTLRMGLLLREFKSRMNSPVKAVIGEPIAREKLNAFGNDAAGCMDFLRKATYELSPRPIDTDLMGHEFEARYKGRSNGSRHFR